MNLVNLFTMGLLWWERHKHCPDDFIIIASIVCIGGLHFANIEMEDERGGLHYVCVVHNTVLRNLVQGDDQVIRPHFVRGLEFTLPLSAFGTLVFLVECLPTNQSIDLSVNQSIQEKAHKTVKNKIKTKNANNKFK